jgi:hypothetical protein
MPQLLASALSANLGQFDYLSRFRTPPRTIQEELINALVQNLAPDWVRARVLAILMLPYQGSYALGEPRLGELSRNDQAFEPTLACAGVGTIATAAFALFARLPHSTADLSPWNHWRMPVVIEEVAADVEQGP